MPQSHVLQFIAGLSFFFFGLHTLHMALNFFAGDRLKNLVAKSTQSTSRSFVLGMVVTFFLQSSSAVTVMTVGMASSGLLSLEQAMAVSLGAGIGTTLVVFLISVKVFVQYGILLVTGGFVLHFFWKRKRVQIIGEVIYGLGFIFVGLLTMSQSMAPLMNFPFLPLVFRFMESHPFANFIIAALITGFVHSSGVILGILVSLAYSGSITFPVAIPLVLGANIGTSFTAVMAAWGSKAEGRRVAWSNLLLRFGAVLLIYPFLPQFTEAIHRINLFVFSFIFNADPSVNAEIAISHFYFNVLVAALFLPLIPLGKKIICWLIPKSIDEKEEFGPKYLDKNALATPSLAFAQVGREMMRMAEIVYTMLKESLSLFVDFNLDKQDYIATSDHKVDRLFKAIKFYLSQLSLQNLKEEEAKSLIQLMTVSNELESMGDTIDRHIARLAHKKWNKGVPFSVEGWKEICEMHESTLVMMQLVMAAFSANSAELAVRVKQHQINYGLRESTLKMNHLQRLHQGLQESIETSAIHLELVTLYHQIHVSLLTMVSPLLGDGR